MESPVKRAALRCRPGGDSRPIELTKPGITRLQIEGMVDDYLRRERFVCSDAYRLGIVDMLCARAFRTNIFTRFKIGTAQADAYMAGYEHSFALWQEVARKGGF